MTETVVFLVFAAVCAGVFWLFTRPQPPPVPPQLPSDRYIRELKEKRRKAALRSASELLR